MQTTLEAHQLVNQDSGRTEWFTPCEITGAACEVMGRIDLDPASCARANVEVVRATRFFTKEDDGLSQRWFGNVWMNHPFEKGKNAWWINKLLFEHQQGRVPQSCNICFAATTEKWFRPLLAYPQCFLHGRTSYLDPITLKPVKGCTKGSVVTYIGPNIRKFAEVFGKLGTVKVVYL